MKSFVFASFLFVYTTIIAQTDYTVIYSADSFIKNGIRLYEEKKYQESIDEYNKVDSLDTSYPTAQYEKAISLFALEKKDLLKSHFEKLYKTNVMQKLPTLYTLYGSYLSDEKLYDDSERIFKEGLLVIPNSSNHLYNLALLYYRKQELQKCIDVLENIISQNPNSASSHYLLGLIAFDNGKISEGTMAMLSYLIIAPNGKFAKNAILKMNAKYGDNYLTKSNYVFSKSGDNFEELETILRNQLPLRSAYKIESKIDDVVTRQVQAVIEYSQSHKIGDGFFETNYIPWLKSVADQKQIEGFSYYMLLAMENELGKNLTSQKKKIIQFTEDYISKDFWTYFAKRKLDMFGTQKEVIVYLENNTPYLIGSFVEGKKEGRFKLLNKYENLDGELQFENNELNGLQKYYDDEGKLSEEKSFTKGKLEGKRTVYYPSGNISLVENYHEGVLEGKTTSYNITGGVNCDGNYSKGELEGLLVCFYPNGSKKSEGNYVSGKMEGQYRSYNKVGDITSDINYKNGELNGKYKQYYDSKTISEEAEYLNDKIVGTFKKYYPNQKLKEEYIYKDNKISLSNEYYATGFKSGESIYNDKGELMMTTYYNPSGEKYYEELYNSKEIKFIKQYSRNNPKPTEINLARKSFEIKSLDGRVMATGSFEKGRRNGEWKNNYTSGNLEMISNFSKGQKQGLNTIYNKNGNITSILNFEKDTLNGRNDIFNDRGLRKTLYYSNGDLNGPYKVYYPEGKLMIEGFYKNDELIGNKKEYSQSGKLISNDNCYNGIIISSDLHNYKGEKETTIEYNNKSGAFSYSMNAGTTTQNYSLKNGYMDGKYLRKDKNNNVLIETEYKNGALQNSYKEYGPNNTLLLEQTYYNGDINGLSKNYDLAGNLKISSEYLFGDEYGKTTRYYSNQMKLFEYNQVDDDIEGEFTYYNKKGEPLVTIIYLNNVPLYYMKKSKTGQLIEKVELINESGVVTSNYPNGKIAIQFTFNKGNKEGNFIINSELGKPEYTSFYKNDLLNNDRIEYYSNGNIYLKEHFVDNDYEGIQEYFKEDGKPWIKAEYKNDELHGKTQIYTNGIITTTKKYDSDSLVEISK